MDTPTFFITTTDNQHYLQGSTSRAFGDLGVESAQLESFEDHGDYINLRYSNNLRLSIPEHRIKHIGEVTT